MKINLEKDFFKTTFEKIKLHPLFKNLKLTDDEIIFNRDKIKDALSKYHLCNLETDKCCNVYNHIKFWRDEDGVLYHCLYNCSKLLDLKKLTDEEKLLNLRKCIISTRIKPTIEKYNLVMEFWAGDFKKYLDKNKDERLRVFFNKTIVLYNKIQSDGVQSLYISYGPRNDLKEKLIYLFFIDFVYSRKKVRVISNDELRDIYFKSLSNQESSKLDNLLELEYLLIYNFNRLNLSNHYILNFFPDFLIKRKLASKKTLIISSINFEDLNQAVVANMKLKGVSTDVSSLLFDLNEVFKDVFGSNIVNYKERKKL